MEELVVATLEAYEAAKALKDGVVSAWSDLSEAYDYIKTFFTSSTDANGSYSDQVLASSLWGMHWVHPQSVMGFISQSASRDLSDTIDRTYLYSLLYTLQARPSWHWGFRFPDDVLLPLYGNDYRDSFMGIYNNLNSISLCIKFNKSKDLESYITNYNNHLAHFVFLFNSGNQFYNRDKFESLYHLKWIKT